MTQRLVRTAVRDLRAGTDGCERLRNETPVEKGRTMRGFGGFGSLVVVLGLSVAVAAGVSGGAGARVSSGSFAGSPSVGGLLVLAGSESTSRVSIVTLAGKRLSVPPNVQISPLGLSPDGRLVAYARASDLVGLPRYPSAVELGGVTGGFKTVLAGSCWSQCPHGPDASFAWSPDASQLAAMVEPASGPTLLRVYDHRGHLLRSYAVPSRDGHGVRTFHHLVSWSPDGSRLLLLQGYTDWNSALILDLRSAKVRTLATWSGWKDQPEALEWSPDGRYIALAGGEGFDGHDYTFAVIDVATGKTLLYCTTGSGCPTRFASGWDHPSAFAWAADSSALFTRSGSSGLIERLELARGRSTIANAGGAGRILAAFDNRLVYDSPAVGSNGSASKHDRLYLLDLGTSQVRQILDSRLGITAVRPLAVLP